MTAPRVGGTSRLLRKHSMTWLVALAACLGVSPAMAQTVVPRPAEDSARADSARAADTGRAATAAGDTARRLDTAGAADTANLPGVAAGDGAPMEDGGPGAGAGTGGPDTLRRDSLPPDSAAAQAAPVAPPAPVDSALAAACEASGGDPPDLLTVMFRASATESERAAAAKAVGGTIVARSEHLEPGAWFLQVPNSAIDPSIADRVIRLPSVLQVGATRCPS